MPEEETLLAESYVTVFKDNRIENNKNDESFWCKVLKKYNKSALHKRNKDMLTGKWTTLNGNFQKFNAIYKFLLRLSRSGKNYVGLLNRVMTIHIVTSQKEDCFLKTTRDKS